MSSKFWFHQLVASFNSYQLLKNLSNLNKVPWGNHGHAPEEKTLLNKIVPTENAALSCWIIKSDTKE